MLIGDLVDRISVSYLTVIIQNLYSVHEVSVSDKFASHEEFFKNDKNI